MATEDIDWLDLPGRWTYGVCRDGRIFFINDETKSTCWTHPGSGCPIQSGHFTWSDMPKGWEMDTMPNGAIFFIKGSQDGALQKFWTTISISPSQHDYCPGMMGVVVHND